MIIAGLIFNLFILVLFTLFAIIIGIQIIQEMTGNAPFVVISNNKLDQIIQALDLKDGNVVYDLGSGNGRVVFAIAQKYPNVKVIGVERSILPFILSSIGKYVKGLKNTKFIFGNFFNISTSKATHIYVYLFPKAMKILLPKFEKELAPGARVVSCDFYFQNKEPLLTIDINKNDASLGKKLFVYEF